MGQTLAAVLPDGAVIVNESITSGGAFETFGEHAVAHDVLNASSGGAIGGDAGKGAAIGAGVCAAGGAARRRQAEQPQAAAQQKAKQEYNAEVAGYKRAFSACMTGRGYTVS